MRPQSCLIEQSVFHTEHYIQALIFWNDSLLRMIKIRKVFWNFNPQLQILTETIKKIGKQLEEVKFNFFKQKESYCSKCKDRNHTTNYCRASPKFAESGYENSLFANSSPTPGKNKSMPIYDNVHPALPPKMHIVAGVGRQN